MSSYQDKEIERLREERKKAEQDMEHERMKAEQEHEKAQNLYNKMMMDKMDDMRQQIRSPQDYMKEISNSVELGKKFGMVDTGQGDRDIALAKLSQDDRHWKEDFEDRKQQRKEGMYREITDIVAGDKGIISKAFDNLDKINALRTGQPSPQQQGVPQYFQDEAGNIIDASGRIIQPTVPVQGGYSDEDKKKINEWRMEHGGSEGHNTEDRSESCIELGEKRTTEKHRAVQRGGYKKSSKRKH